MCFSSHRPSFTGKGMDADRCLTMPQLLSSLQRRPFLSIESVWAALQAKRKPEGSPLACPAPTKSAAQRIAHNNTIIFALLNKGFIDFGTNWFHHLQKLKVRIHTSSEIKHTIYPCPALKPGYLNRKHLCILEQESLAFHVRPGIHLTVLCIGFGNNLHMQI